MTTAPVRAPQHHDSTLIQLVHWPGIVPPSPFHFRGRGQGLGPLRNDFEAARDLGQVGEGARLAAQIRRAEDQ